MKRLEKVARTASQFRTLAAYYRQKQQDFSAKAAEQQIEWKRRSNNVTGPNAKSPRPVDSARNLYEYYWYQSDRAAKLADQYEKDAQTHTAPDVAAASN